MRPRLDAPIAVPPRSGSETRFVVVTNRIPGDGIDPRHADMTALSAAVDPLVSSRRGVWLGWNGRVSSSADISRETGSARQASLELSSDIAERYRDGFCHQSLWPLFHGFVEHVRFDDGAQPLDWPRRCATGSTSPRSSSSLRRTTTTQACSF
jgi:trehalose-6-phosphate synthase